MNKRLQIDASLALEHRLAQSIEKVKESVGRSKALREQIIKLRRERRQVQAVPEDVRAWFEETAPYVDDEETEEGEEA
jgi:hypothetical protein